MQYIFLSFIFVTVPLIAELFPTNIINQSNYQLIEGDQLKTWYDENRSMVVLDARSDPYFDGDLLPNAIRMTRRASVELIEEVIPSKNSLIVVYCSGYHCPASGWLYDKLAALGYNNVYEYQAGYEDWIERGFPTSTL